MENRPTSSGVKSPAVVTSDLLASLRASADVERSFGNVHADLLTQAAKEIEIQRETVKFCLEEHARLERYIIRLCEAAGVTPEEREPTIGYVARARTVIFELANNQVSR